MKKTTYQYSGVWIGLKDTVESGVKFEFETVGGQLCSNFTAQRVENGISHHIDNLEAYCRYCNCSAC